MAIQFCLVLATRLSKLDNGVAWLLGIIKTYWANGFKPKELDELRPRSPH